MLFSRLEKLGSRLVDKKDEIIVIILPLSLVVRRWSLVLACSVFRFDAICWPGAVLLYVLTWKNEGAGCSNIYLQRTIME